MVAESTRLATLLRAGSLPASLEFLEERTVGPELGQDSIDAGKIACLVGFAAVLIFMFLSYGTFGIFANIALVINVGLMFGLLSMIGATLTLPGIAGIVLTIGMAVDANVLVLGWPAAACGRQLRLGRLWGHCDAAGRCRAHPAVQSGEARRLVWPWLVWPWLVWPWLVWP